MKNERSAWAMRVMAAPLLSGAANPSGGVKKAIASSGPFFVLKDTLVWSFPFPNENTCSGVTEENANNGFAFSSPNGASRYKSRMNVSVMSSGESTASTTISRAVDATVSRIAAYASLRRASKV